MAAVVPSRWHDAGVRLAPQDTPAKQAALGFALYGLRLQAERVEPKTVEATITITGADGQPMGRLDLDADDAVRILRAMTPVLDDEFGPWKRADLDRLQADLDQQ